MLSNCTFDNTKKLEDLVHSGIYEAKVVKVYDGDTVWVVYNNPYIGPLKSKVRFTRINAAEIRGNKDETPDEKTIRVRESSRAKQFVEKIIGDKIIKIRVLQFDKYSRLLSDILVPKSVWMESGLPIEKITIEGGQEYIDLSDYMLDHNYAILYS